MKTFHFYDAPLTVCGLPFYHGEKELRRLPQSLIDTLGLDERIGTRTPAVRVRFRTDAAHFTVHMTLATLMKDSGMSMFGAQSATVMLGDWKHARFGGLATPKDYDTKTATADIWKGNGMEDVTVILPRNEVVADLRIEVPDEAQVAAPTPYANGPVLYYGSSITEGGCACNAFNAYNMLISRHLDLDFYNFGFSNSAKGELAMADYINTVPVKAFIMDYDHNAPSAQHLWNTHEAFFRRIREKQPTLPVLFLTMPAAEYSEGKKARRAAVRATYDHAVAAGDKHVWFIDGETLLAGADAWLCTVDNTHPNDLGFHRMAAVIEPVVREMLGI